MSLSHMITNSLTAAIITNPRLPDNPIVECNDAFVALTGYGRDEIIGHNCRFLSGPETEPELTETLRTAIRQSRPALVELLNYKKNGTPFRNAVMVAPIFDAAGEVEYFLGSQVEVAGPAMRSPARGEGARARADALSGRQREVLVMLASGKRNKQIAHELRLTERTVKMHRAALLKALGVATSAEAIRIAVEAGL